MRLDPKRCIGPEVFNVRKLLCASHSGKGTGLECSECVMHIGDERDRYRNENSVLRDDYRSIDGWYWAMTEYLDDGWCGSFTTLEDAKQHASECLDDGQSVDEDVSFVRFIIETKAIRSAIAALCIAFSLMITAEKDAVMQEEKKGD